MKSTKFDKLMKVYLELSDEFKALEDESVKRMLESWSVSFKQIDGFLESKKVRKSQITSGLDQGLRELPEIISDLPESERELDLLKLHSVIDNNIPGFY